MSAPIGADAAEAVRRLADRDVLQRRQGDLLQRRGDSADLPARLTPTATSSCSSAAPTSSRSGDLFLTTTYPVIDVGTRRQHSGRHQRIEPAARHHDSERQSRGRHLRRPRPRPALGRSRRRRVSRHADDRPRPHPGSDREGEDARRGEGGWSRRATTTVATARRPAHGPPISSSRPFTASSRNDSRSVRLQPDQHSLTACRVAAAAPHAGKSTSARTLAMPARLAAISLRHPLRGSKRPS